MARHQDGVTFMTTLTYAPYAAAIALRALSSGGGR
jgi:hypothetical protein